MKKPNVQRKKTWHIMKGKDLNEKQKNIFNKKGCKDIFFHQTREKHIRFNYSINNSIKRTSLLTESQFWWSFEQNH